MFKVFRTKLKSCALNAHISVMNALADISEEMPKKDEQDSRLIGMMACVVTAVFVAFSSLGANDMTKGYD